MCQRALCCLRIARHFCAVPLTVSGDDELGRCEKLRNEGVQTSRVCFTRAAGNSFPFEAGVTLVTVVWMQIRPRKEGGCEAGVFGA